MSAFPALQAAPRHAARPRWPPGQPHTCRAQPGLWASALAVSPAGNALPPVTPIAQSLSPFKCVLKYLLGEASLSHLGLYLFRSPHLLSLVIFLLSVCHPKHNVFNLLINVYLRLSPQLPDGSCMRTSYWTGQVWTRKWQLSLGAKAQTPFRGLRTQQSETLSP